MSKIRVSADPVSGGWMSKIRVSADPVSGGCMSKIRVSADPVSGGWMSKIRVSADPVSGGHHLPGLQADTHSPRPHKVEREWIWDLFLLI